MLIFFIIFSLGQLFASDAGFADEASNRNQASVSSSQNQNDPINLQNIHIVIPPNHAMHPIAQQLLEEEEWFQEIERLEQEATKDLQAFICLGLVGMGTLLTGLAVPSDSNAYWWLTIPGFFISCIAGIAGGSYFFRKAQICCMQIGPRRL